MFNITKWLRRRRRMPDAIKASLINTFVNAIRLLWEIIKSLQVGSMYNIYTTAL